MFDRYKLKRTPKIKTPSKNLKNKKPETVKVKIRHKKKKLKV